MGRPWLECASRPVGPQSGAVRVIYANTLLLAQSTDPRPGSVGGALTECGTYYVLSMKSVVTYVALLGDRVQVSVVHVLWSILTLYICGIFLPNTFFFDELNVN